ncbi:hypothetical protein KK101_02350 [Curtobacterium flaccumfaciens pv. oortii]|uniref:hypothetical protein n=1 Tax=Curtobacterium flaccumfaciens TaxID=2035 RepID=UPI001BDF0BD0|nr:hypothetical protein [Curtobacterium flaccumfaciens]MBT1621523.1 hypothetical protein [Curtobacterium flaccumfaciens pv. oortii]
MNVLEEILVHHRCNYSPRLRSITEPETGSNRAERRAKRYKTYTDAADYFQCGPRAVERWVREGWIAGYRDASGTIFVDLDEVEAAFQAGKMRDPRKRYGSKARIVPLPIVRDAVAEDAR